MIEPSSGTLGVESAPLRVMLVKEGCRPAPANQHNTTYQNVVPATQR